MGPHAEDERQEGGAWVLDGHGAITPANLPA